MAIKIQIVAEDKATPVVNKAFDNTARKSNEVAGKVGDRFRDVFENVSQNATGAFGSVAGGLFKLPGIAGIAVGAILGIGGAFVAMATKSAEATAATNSDSARFLANINSLKNSLSGAVDIVGSGVVPVFNRLAEIFGFGAKKADEFKIAYDAALTAFKTQKDEIAQLVEKFRTAGEIESGKFNELIGLSEKLKTLEGTRAGVLNQIEAIEKNIAKQREDALKNEGLAFLLDQKTRAEFEKKLLAQNSSIVPLREQLSILNQQINQTGKLLVAEDERLKTNKQVVTTQAVSKKIVEDNTKDLDKLRIFQEKAEKEHQALIASGFANSQAFVERVRKTQELESLERRKNILEEQRLKDEADKKSLAQLDAQLKAQQQIGAQIFSGIAQSLAAGVIQGERLGKVLDGILKQLATRLLASLLFKGIGAAFGPGVFGAVGGIFGGFQHGGEFTVGGVPGVDQNLVAFRATRGERVRITPQGQTTNNITNNNSSPVNINLTLNSGGNIDESFVRYKLIPILNREARLGTRVRSNS